MTDLQQQIIDVATAFYKENKYPCSQAYLARHFKVTPPTMKQHVDTIIRKGKLRLVEGKVMPK